MVYIFDAAPVSLRTDLSGALNRAHKRLGQTGDWLNGEQRRAVVAETRHSWDCHLCQARKLEPSPYSVSGEHQTFGNLPASWLNVIHRVATDPGRLSKRWFQEALSSGLEEDEFIEIVSVCAGTSFRCFFNRYWHGSSTSSRSQGWRSAALQTSWS